MVGLTMVDNMMVKYNACKAMTVPMLNSDRTV